MDWNKREMDWYHAAIKANNYPENIINFIDPLLEKDYTMLDIGCGIGTFAHELVEKVNNVIGVDYSEEMLAYLKKINYDQNNKIKVKQGDWNKLDFSSERPINGLITAYSGKEVVGNRDSILKMESLVDDIIFFFVPGERKKHSFATDELFARLGRPKRKHTVCYEDVFKVLDSLNINYNYKHFQYSFGQPFVDFKQAVEFFKFHYNIKNEEKNILNSFLKDNLQKKGDHLWIDNLKNSTLLWWRPAK